MSTIVAYEHMAILCPRCGEDAPAIDPDWEPDPLTMSELLDRINRNGELGEQVDERGELWCGVCEETIAHFSRGWIPA